MTAPEFYCTDCETMMPVDISGRGACGHGRMIRADLAAVQPDPRDEVIARLVGELDVALAANRGLVRLNEMTEARVERLVESLEEIASYDTGATAGLAYTARAALAAAKAVQHG